MPGIIRELPTIDNFFDSMGWYRNLGMLIETSGTAEVIQKNEEAVVDMYNLSGLIEEEMSIFFPEV